VKNIGIVVNQNKKNALQGLKSLKRWLKARGFQTFDDTVIPRSQIPRVSDLIIVLGGDGTILNIAKYLTGRPVPILGINLGGLGFLTETPFRELYTTLKEVLKGKGRISERTTLSVRIVQGKSANPKRTESFRALNDVVVSKGTLSRILTLKLYIDGSYITTYLCDGLIFSTATGSTAHSLSAGGPIVYPELEVTVITAISPHTLSNRPLLLPAKSEAMIKYDGNEEQLCVTIDGQTGIELGKDDVIKVKKSPGKIRLIIPEGKNYYQTLSKKLGWRGHI